MTTGQPADTNQSRARRAPSLSVLVLLFFFAGRKKKNISISSSPVHCCFDAGFVSPLSLSISREKRWHLRVSRGERNRMTGVLRGSLGPHLIFFPPFSCTRLLLLLHLRAPCNAISPLRASWIMRALLAWRSCRVMCSYIWVT